MRLNKSIKYIIPVIFLFAATAQAQQTNPVDKQVANPITDTPNVNPVAPEQDIKAPKTRPNPVFKKEGGDDELIVYSNITNKNFYFNLTSFLGVLGVLCG